MLSPIAISNYFITKAQETQDELTLMKLLKMVYISHGWHLGLKDKPLISEHVQAWKYGPVVPSVYHGFKENGDDQITSVLSEYGDIHLPTEQEDKDFLDTVWNVYRVYDGLELSTMTHQPESPWSQVWQENPGKFNIIIPNEIIAAHYKRKSTADIYAA